MKLTYKIACGLLVFNCLSTSCTKDFIDLNTNPESIVDVEPTSLFYTAQTQMLTAGNLWNDVYASKLRWMQYTSNIWGYSTTNFSIFTSSIGSSVYSEYNKIGSYVSNIEFVLSNGSTQNYPGLEQIARIMLIAKGIQTSDIHGSLAYSDAWKARAGDQSEAALNPKFQTQEELYNIWDTELVKIIDNLKTLSSSDNSINDYDRAYKGDISKWIKAANALRLRVALRFWNRSPEKANEIASQVLKSDNSANLMASIDDSYVLWHANDYTVYNQGDWHSIYDMDCASGPFMNYLKKYNDPRKGIFFLPNNLTTANIAAYNAQANDKKIGFENASGVVTDASRNISPTMTQWEGGTVSFDLRQKDEPYLARVLYTNPSVNMRAMNYPQTKLWKGTGYDGKGTGGNFAPILTYADFCFMAAEFVQRIQVASTHSAQEWYELGVKASLAQWDKFAEYSKTDNYLKLTDNEINNFVNQPGIKWEATTALEQIYTQAYVEHFKNTNESWAQWKRTGYPNTNTSIIKWDKVLIEGQEQRVPRKVKFTYPVAGTNNAENLKEKLDKMSSFPEFGSVDNEFGRLWSEK